MAAIFYRLVDRLVRPIGQSKKSNQMTASVVELISGLVCFVAIIEFFGYIFKSIDLII